MSTREFKKVDGKRLVKAIRAMNHMYHPECAPEEAGGVEVWAITNHSCCAKCHEALYKEIKRNT
jgi:hypothetical protein